MPALPPQAWVSIRGAHFFAPPLSFNTFDSMIHFATLVALAATLLAGSAPAHASSAPIDPQADATLHPPHVNATQPATQTQDAHTHAISDNVTIIGPKCGIIPADGTKVEIQLKIQGEQSEVFKWSVWEDYVSDTELQDASTETIAGTGNLEWTFTKTFKIWCENGTLRGISNNSGEKEVEIFVLVENPVGGNITESNRIKLKCGAPKAKTKASFDGTHGSLGPSWLPREGLQERYFDFGRGVPGQQNAMSSHLHAAVPYFGEVELDLLPPTGSLSYVASVTGDNGQGTMLYTKIQSESGTLHDHIGFYVGFNGGGTPEYGGYFPITPFAQARVRFYGSNSGDTMNIDIDTNFDGITDHHYEASGLNDLYLDWGTGVGIGTYGDGSFDNWEVRTYDELRPALALNNFVSGQVASLTISHADPLSLVAIGYSLSGLAVNPVQGPCGSILLSIAHPIEVIAVSPTDVQGTLQVNVPIPASAAGVTVWAQAADILSCATSTVQYVTIQ